MFFLVCYLAFPEYFEEFKNSVVCKRPMQLMKKPVNSKLNADQIDFLENKIVRYVLELYENQYDSE